MTSPTTHPSPASQSEQRRSSRGCFRCPLCRNQPSLPHRGPVWAGIARELQLSWGRWRVVEGCDWPWIGSLQQLRSSLPTIHTSIQVYLRSTRTGNTTKIPIS
ncbi:predicted protein [Histoplasma capsulatum H143]|uniref:Uncharacterized protein n=1 Tax=Ajellomyces capsulatus (strain H143) TaxID=544712 RepID=C6HFN6_AJECH|nr:predicted protein [Histoplasma capsulatum H143]